MGVGGVARAAPARQVRCGFQLGFATLRGLVGGATVGQCLENEHFNPANGNAEQRTAGGLLVWRKADNWTAFTDGYWTWINGPEGLAQRLSTQRFAWESDAATGAAAPVFTLAPPPTVIPTAAPVGATRERPISRGSAAGVAADGWRLGVLGVTPNATAGVQAANRFNRPPVAGRQMFVVRLSATRTGGMPERFSQGRLHLVGAANVAYETYDPGCGVIPNELPPTEVFTNETITGSVCWQVPSGEVDTLVLYYTTGTFPTQRVYFALR
jgi:hypothetical protein